MGERHSSPSDMMTADQAVRSAEHLEGRERQVQSSTAGERETLALVSLLLRLVVVVVCRVYSSAYAEGRIASLQVLWVGVLVSQVSTSFLLFPESRQSVGSP